MRFVYHFVLGSFFLGVSVSMVSARVIHIASYQELFKEADVIVIASAISTRTTSDKFEDHGWPLEFVGLNTTFQVNQVLKGDYREGSIKVLHFKFGELRRRPGKAGTSSDEEDCQTQIIDGPFFVTFRTKRMTISITGQRVSMPKPEYVLFLKLRKDGRYEPVTGPIDPQFSVREMFTPLPAILGGSASED